MEKFYHTSFVQLYSAAKFMNFCGRHKNARCRINLMNAFLSLSFPFSVQFRNDSPLDTFHFSFKFISGEFLSHFEYFINLMGSSPPIASQNWIPEKCSHMLRIYFQELKLSLNRPEKRTVHLNGMFFLVYFTEFSDIWLTRFLLSSYIKIEKTVFHTCLSPLWNCKWI